MDRTCHLKAFFLEYFPFQKGIHVQKSKLEVTDVVSLVKMAEIFQVYPIPSSFAYFIFKTGLVAHVKLYSCTEEVP